MLKKLLKYDLGAMFRVWWIAAVVSLVMSILGGGCLYIRNYERIFPRALYTLSGILIFLTVLALGVFFILSAILVLLRLYRNFFTDEGYLTFTLPVHRRDLVNSKILSGSIVQLSTGVLLFFEILLMIFLREPKRYLSIANWERNIQGFLEFIKPIWGYVTVYAIEVLILGLLCLVGSILFLYVCVSFAAMIVKKGKLVVGIAIYYFANNILVFIVEMMLLFGFTSIISWLGPLSDRGEMNATIFLLAGLIFFAGMLCSVFYCLFHYLVDRKLNLS